MNLKRDVHELENKIKKNKSYIQQLRMIRGISEGSSPASSIQKNRVSLNSKTGSLSTAITSTMSFITSAKNKDNFKSSLCNPVLEASRNSILSSSPQNRERFSSLCSPIFHKVDNKDGPNWTMSNFNYHISSDDEIQRMVGQLLFNSFESYY